MMGGSPSAGCLRNCVSWVRWRTGKTCWNERLDVPTYAFLLLFHAAGHLGHRAVNGRIIWQIRQLLGHVDRHGLGSVQLARPERQLAHPEGGWLARVDNQGWLAAPWGQSCRLGEASGLWNAVLLRPGWGPWGRITRHRERSGPHRSPAIALEHGHSVTKRDISLWKHVCVTRSLLKAIMADAQPFNTFGRRRAVPRADVRRAGIGALPPPRHQWDLHAYWCIAPAASEHTPRSMSKLKVKSISCGSTLGWIELPLVILRIKLINAKKAVKVN